MKQIKIPNIQHSFSKLTNQKGQEAKKLPLQKLLSNASQTSSSTNSQKCGPEATEAIQMHKATNNRSKRLETGSPVGRSKRRLLMILRNAKNGIFLRIRK